MLSASRAVLRIHVPAVVVLSIIIGVLADRPPWERQRGLDADKRPCFRLGPIEVLAKCKHSWFQTQQLQLSESIFLFWQQTHWRKNMGFMRSNQNVDFPSRTNLSVSHTPLFPTSCSDLAAFADSTQQEDPVWSHKIFLWSRNTRNTRQIRFQAPISLRQKFQALARGSNVCTQ